MLKLFKLRMITWFFNENISPSLSHWLFREAERWLIKITNLPECQQFVSFFSIEFSQYLEKLGGSLMMLVCIYTGQQFQGAGEFWVPKQRHGKEAWFSEMDYSALSENETRLKCLKLGT